MVTDLTEAPTWFGTQDRPLFGWLHVPHDLRARGGVVLCPPLGREAELAHRAYRLLATQLKDAGFTVLRFDYAGTGDAAGSERDPDQVQGWLTSIQAAVDLLRTWGATRIILVGMRMGATLAAFAAARTVDVDRLVLWDPCASGRSFLHEERALQVKSLRSAVREDGSVEAFGYLYSAATVKDLYSLDLVALRGRLADNVFVLVRPDRPAQRRLIERLSMPHTEWADATGQVELLHSGQVSAVPEASLKDIVLWLSRGMPADHLPVSPQSTAVDAVVQNPIGQLVVEQTDFLGPLGLFGISTELATGGGGPTVIFLNVAAEHHIGPGRLWVELARCWASFGLRSVRLDLAGIGDSPVRQGHRPDDAYPAEALEDIVDVARSVSPHDPRNVVVVGLCSGAYHAVNVGDILAPRGVLAINPPLAFVPPRVRAVEMTRGRRSSRLSLPCIEGLIESRVASQVRPLVPPACWWVLDRLFARVGVRGTPRLPPSTALKALLSANVDTVILCGEEEARQIRMRARKTLRKCAGSDLFCFETMARVDHNLFGRSGRDDVIRLLTDHVKSRFAPLLSFGVDGLV